MQRKSNAESVAVYCRVRPIEEDDESCLTVLNEQQVVLRESEAHANAKGNGAAIRESTFNFTYVFHQDTSQRQMFDHVAHDLISNLLRGNSSLLMTYGVTSSGKTFTMNGKPSDIGILPRSIDVLFNTIKNYLAHKYVFRPDKLNGFEIQSEADAITERQRNMEKHLKGDKSGSRAKSEFKHRVSDVRKVADVDEDNVYGVFVSYIEIYNNYVFDLLDDAFENTITGERKSKNIREDANRIMYVSGANEVEVDSVDEAFYWLNKGQQRRRFADTALNRESSRSHSIFKIRVVQAPIEKDNEPVNDKSCLLVSQLCLVDLAGSERLVRTKATGSRLAEAKSINSSLMVLKNCIDALRENQRDRSATRIVPYRDSKLTHLFRNFFEGNGIVRMICCVNPHINEYDENLHVLNFAEACREVEIPCVDEARKEKMRKRANKIFENSMVKLSGGGDAKRRCTWSFPNFPFDEIQSPASENFYSIFTEHLNEVESLRSQYWKFYEGEFAEAVDAVDQSINENLSLASTVKEYDEKLANKSRQVANLENRIRSLEKKLTRSEMEVRDVRNELQEKESVIEANNKQIKEMKNRLKFEREIYQKDLNKQMKECNHSWQMKWEMQNAKWRTLREMVNKNGEIFDTKQMNELLMSPEPIRIQAEVDTPEIFPQGKPTTSASDEIIACSEEPLSSKTPSKTPSSSKPFRVKQRRSRSAQRWVEHKDVDCIDTGTVFKSSLKHKKTVNVAPTLKDMKNQSNYVLQHQEIDTEGEVETRLYKADIIPTRSGGSQVEFNDVETLTTRSPHKVSFCFVLFLLFLSNIHLINISEQE